MYSRTSTTAGAVAAAHGTIGEISTAKTAFSGARAMAAGMMVLLGLSFCGIAFADASYQSSTQITGGALVDSMKSIPFMGKTMKKMFAPVSTTTMVCGNRKAVVNEDSVEIIDLDKEEMIQIDNVKKTYTVITFAQMRQAMQEIPERIEQAEAQRPQQPEQPEQPKPNLKTSFNVDVKNTGAQKEVNGLMAQEQIVTLTMTVTNLDAPANGPNGQTNTMTYVLSTDAWIAPDPPEKKEIADFDVRMGQKMMQGVDMQAWLASMRHSSSGMSQLLGSKPGATDAMTQMGKEMAKLKGTRVMETMSMGGMVPAGSGQAQGSGQGSGQASGQGSGQGSNQTGGQVAGQVAGDTATQTAADESSRRMGSFGSALGGSMLSAWHKKKAKANSDSNSDTNSNTATANGSGSSGAAANGGAQGTQNVVLMSMTTQESNFSQGAVPASVFEIPAGYMKLESPVARMQ